MKVRELVQRIYEDTNKLQDIKAGLEHDIVLHTHHDSLAISISPYGAVYDIFFRATDDGLYARYDNTGVPEISDVKKASEILENFLNLEVEGE